MQVFSVNAFTSTPFKGNPASVCMVPTMELEKAAEPYFRSIAGEVSVVETAFILPPREPKTHFHIRFLTRVKETPFCGLAAAHILVTEFNFTGDEVFFSTETHGVLRVGLVPNSKQYELDLRPTLPTPLHNLTANEIKQLASVLCIPESSIRHVAMHPSSSNLILTLSAATHVMSAAPRPTILMDLLKDKGIVKITLTAAPIILPKSNSQKSSFYTSDFNEEVEKKWAGYDFISRLFAPWIGINEDAVSGATHAVLAKHWGSLEPSLQAKTTLRCFQPSVRTGELFIKVNGDHVKVSGEAVTISKGVVTCPLLPSSPQQLLKSNI